MEKRTSAEVDFIEETARQMLAEDWARHQVVHGSLDGVSLQQPFCDAAVEKGWVSLKGQHPKVLAKGFSAAAAFLRR